LIVCSIVFSPEIQLIVTFTDRDAARLDSVQNIEAINRNSSNKLRRQSTLNLLQDFQLLA
jgi:hypothetical protein